MFFLSKLFESKTNAAEAAILLTSLLDVKISSSTLTKEIEEHPDYPSLLSISDVFKAYGVENVGINFDPDKFAAIPTPFITQIRGKKNSIKLFSVVKEVSNDTVHFFHPEKHKWVYVSKEDFLKRSSNTVLLTEVKVDAGEKGFKQKVKEERKIRLAQYLISFCIPALVILDGLIAFSKNGISAMLPFIFSILTLAGCIIGVLLTWYEIDLHNPLLQQICGTGKKINCSAVLQSKGAKIAGISWSSIGFIYFTGMMLSLLFGGLTNIGTLFIAAWLSTTATPYVLFSVYYQWQVARQWCVLCLSVQGLLLLQFTVVLIGSWHNLLSFSQITSGTIIQTLSAFVIPFIVTALLLPALKKAKESSQIYNELQRLKHNEQIFEALLQKQKIVTENPEGLGITLGNHKATYKLLKVCNPYCGPCAKAHSPIEEILQNNPDVQVQILFTATNSEGDFRTPPVKHLLAIAECNNETIIKKSLDDWYLAETNDYDSFAAKYPMNGELNQQAGKIQAMQDWCDKVIIDFTPTFFVSINGRENEKTTMFYQLPEIYTVADLKYFLSA